MRSTPAVLLAGLSLSAALLSGCNADAEKADSTAPETDGYPVTVTNCDTDVTLDAPPERIVTIKSSATELVLALGRGDRLVGTAFADGPVPAAWADEAADVAVLSDQAPSQEAVLEVEPDLVFAGWESNLAADTAGERDTLAQLGVSSYVAPSACQSAGAPKKMTYDLLFDHFREAGALLDAGDAADDLVTEQQATLDDLGVVADGTTALWWSSGTDTPFVGGDIGAPQMVMEQIGLTNIVDDVNQTWSSLGWETVIDADPDVLVLVDAAWNTADDKIAFLKSNPATAEMSAVKAERFLVIPFPASEAGVRSVDAAADLLTQAEELGFAAPGQDQE